MNTVEIIGRCGENCKVRDFNNSSLVTFSLAWTGKFKSKDGGQAARVHFFDVEKWTDDPGKYERMLVKGKLVHVKGSLSKDSWLDKQTQVRKYAVKIKADTIERAEREDGDTGATADAPSPDRPVTPELVGAGVAQEPEDDDSSSMPF